MSKIHNPHDIFTKIMLSDPDAARVFLRRFLPAELSDKLDFLTLKHVDQTFISEDMKESFADIVFECGLRSEDEKLRLYISILIEHKSNPEEFVVIQLGHYSMSGYKKQIANKTRPLRPIISFLYYHGDQEWTPKKLVDLFDLFPNQIKKYIPDFEFIYQDVTRMTDNEIRSLENNILIPGLLMQKYHKDLQHLLEIASDIFQYLNEMDGTGNLQTTYFVYLFDLFKDQKEKIMQKFEETIWPTEDRTKNYILQLMDKGKEEEKYRTVKNMISEGLETPFICRIAEATPEYVENVRQDLEEP